MKISEVCEYLDKRFPLEFAEDFDKAIGFAIGCKEIEVKNILLALDLNKEVIEDAIKKECNLIITHHPFLFNPIYKVIYDEQKGSIIKLMIENNLSLYSMHTNLDVASGGVNDVLAEMLGIEEINIINNEVAKGNYLRYGNIKEMTLGELANNVKMTFNLSGVRVQGDLNKPIKTIGVLGGAGSYDADIMLAKKSGCDCYITGEIHLNNSQYADFLDISLIEVNHGVEKFVFYSLKEELEKVFIDNNNYKGKIIVTNVTTDKLNFM